jgi:ankyrin repeat protein
MKNNSDFENLNIKLLGSAGRGEYEQVKEFIELGANINHQNDTGKTALMKAFSNGHFELGMLLIKKGADLSLKDKVGNTALTVLVSLPQEEVTGEWNEDIREKIFDELMAKDIPVNHRDFFGGNLFKKAYENNNLSLALYLLNKNIRASQEELNECLHKVVENDPSMEDAFQMDAIRYLLKRGADINAKDPLGRTPVMIALKGFQFEIAEKLIDLNADLKAKDILDATVFDYMCIFPSYLNDSGFPGFLSVLYRSTLYGILNQYTKEVKSFKPEETLPTAIKKENYYMVELLLRKGAKCDKKTLDALIQNSYRVPSVFFKSHYLETLLQKGANINAQDRKDRNALMHFILKGKLQEAKLLVEKGASVLGKDHEGKGPFAYLSQIKRVYGYGDNGERITALFEAMLSGVKPKEKSDVLKMVVTESIKNENWFLIGECVDKGFDYKNTLIHGKTLAQLANVEGGETIFKKINALNVDQDQRFLEAIYKKGEPSRNPSYQKMDPISQDALDLQMETLIGVLMNKEKKYLKDEVEFRKNTEDQSIESSFWFQLKKMDSDFEELKDRIENLIRATKSMGADLDKRDPQGHTYLMKAIEEGAYQTAKVLISSDANIHAKDSQGFDALSYLATSPFSDSRNEELTSFQAFSWELVYEELMQKDVDLKRMDAFGVGLVEKAILTQNYNIALRMMEDGAPTSKKLLEEKLGEFSKYDSLEPLVRNVLNRGVSSKKVDHEGRDPLMNALMYGAIENACLIGKNKDNLDYVDKRGNNIYHYLTDALKRAEQWYQADMPFGLNDFYMEKFNKNFRKMMKEAISKNGKLDQKNDFGITPLLHALNHGVLGLARRLIQNNARMDICDNMGNNPFHFMCKISEPFTDKQQERFLGLMKSFYENGVNPFKENIYGDTPISLAESSGNLLAVKTILGYYYELPMDVKNKDGVTPLMKACFEGNILDIRRLMSKDMEKTVKDHEGKTPLFYAVMGNQPEVIAELAKTLSDVQILDQKGNSAIDIAIRYNKPEALFTLLELYEKEIPYLPVKAESLEQLNPLLREHMHRMSEKNENDCIRFMTHHIQKISPNHRILKRISISNGIRECHHQPKAPEMRKIERGFRKPRAFMKGKPRIIGKGPGFMGKTFSI